MPLVSILLPVYNAASDLPRAVRSLLEQTFKDFEVIAIDDGSTDGSGDLLDRYAHADTRIRVFHQENAGVLGKVLNLAAEHAQGKYLARQDADDASDASRLENQVKYLEAHPDTGLCGTWVWFIDTSLGPLFSLELPDDHARLNHYLTKGMNPFVHGSIMFRADVFQKMGGYRGSYAEDFDLWLRMSEVTRLGICTALGYYYWRSEGGISSGANLRQQSLNQLSLKLHSERVRLGQEMTDWQSEYQKIVDIPTDESDPGERQTLLHYARGLQLLHHKRFAASQDEFKKAAAGQGLYAKKARRNLSIFWLAPALSIAYHLLECREPFHFARILPARTDLPSFSPKTEDR
jgi:glycosyltransferase involved in cell wall biosynthesis